MSKLLEYIKAQIPFDVKRPSSMLSLVLALVFAGFFTGMGWWLFDSVLKAITPYVPKFITIIIFILTYSIPINVNILEASFFIFLFFIVYRFFDRQLLLKLGTTTVFEDKFDFGNQGWFLNYWGSNNPHETCNFEASSIVFRAQEEDLADPRKEYGAYFDLRSGIYERSKYEVSCLVRSEENTTMGFKLWVHDSVGQNEMLSPANFYTPGQKLEEIKVGFVGTSTQALRIHLHNKAGLGKIFVDNVKVIKVKQA